MIVCGEFLRPLAALTTVSDVLRSIETMITSMDKYYMLVREFVNSSFRLLIRTQWDGASVREYNDILTCRGGPLW